MELSLIAAVSKNGVIGKKGNLLWNIPEDLKRFKELTLNHPIIMGRKTYESIITLKHFLTERISIVLTSKEILDETIKVASNLEEALNYCKEYPLAYVIGGQQIYEQTINLPETKNLEITEIHETCEGDTFFPYINPKIWKEFNREDKKGYSFVTYKKFN